MRDANLMEALTYHSKAKKNFYEKVIESMRVPRPVTMRNSAVMVRTCQEGIPGAESKSRSNLDLPSG